MIRSRKQRLLPDPPNLKALPSQYLNNRLEQDHRGVKGRSGPMRGFESPRSASEFCRAYNELRNFLRSHSRINQPVSADYRRFHFLRRTATVQRVLEAAEKRRPSLSHLYLLARVLTEPRQRQRDKPLP
jgi:hypothetical protein